MEFSSFEDLWRIQSNAQGPLKPYISSLSEDRRQLLKERLRAEILGNRESFVQLFATVDTPDWHSIVSPEGLEEREDDHGGISCD